MNPISFALVLALSMFAASASFQHNKDAITIENFRAVDPYYYLNNVYDTIKRKKKKHLKQLSTTFLQSNPDPWILNTLKRLHHPDSIHFLLSVEAKAFSLPTRTYEHGPLTIFLKWVKVMRQQIKKLEKGKTAKPTKQPQPSRAPNPTAAPAPRTTTTEPVDYTDYTTMTEPEDTVTFARSMVEAHNEVRQAVGLQAYRLNEDLVQLASTWSQALADSEGCELAHSSDEYRSNVGGFSLVGENLFKTTDALDASVVVMTWYSEKDAYKYGPIGSGCSNFENTLHFSQVMWEHTLEIGCGYAMCPDGEGVVASCNYGPMGNVMNHCPFHADAASKLGLGSTPCSECNFSAPPTRMLRKS